MQNLDHFVITYFILDNSLRMSRILKISLLAFTLIFLFVEACENPLKEKKKRQEVLKYVDD